MRTTTSLTRPLTRGLAALAVGGALVLTGCGAEDEPDSEDTSAESGEESPEEPEPEGEPETEEPETEESEGAGAGSVTYDLPEEWEDVTAEVGEQAAQTGQEVASAARDTAGGDIPDNVNVIQLPSPPGDDLDQIERQALQQLETAGIQDAETLGRVDLDGEEASRQSGVAGQGPAEIRIEQLITLRDDAAWVVTFSHSTETPNADRQADIDTVVGSIDFQD